MIMEVYMSKEEKMVGVLEKFWPRNKAKGLLCQTVFQNEINNGIFGPDASEKIFPGCWTLAPKEVDFYNFRFCFFIHSDILRNDDNDFTPKKLLGDKFRPFYAIAEYLKNAGIGLVYCTPSTEEGHINIDRIQEKKYNDISWNFFKFQNEKFEPVDSRDFFGMWAGNKGRPSRGNNWNPDVKADFKRQPVNTIKAHLLNELFMTGYLKSILRKPLNDPYDVDNFLISLSQKHVFPMEIKEKFPAPDRHGNFFGIDAGRILMLLRLCIPNESNAIYLIRELDESGKFISWKYMTLSDIIMTASWNLQAGGPGMGGQSTQTVRLPYNEFKEFKKEEMTEDSLQKIGSLPKDIKKMAKKIGTEIDNRFSPNKINQQVKF